MRAGGLGGGPGKFEESKRKPFSVSTLGSPTKRLPITCSVKGVEERKQNIHESLFTLADILFLGNASPNPAVFRCAAGFQCPTFFRFVLDA
jgi:hypothetical protein